jgi:hypothetical protein
MSEQQFDRLMARLLATNTMLLIIQFLLTLLVLKP